jgi:glycosyltransferase involved in cell wall biosynthesis
MQNNPQLSVVIASLNGLRYVQACLESLHAQTGGIDAEIIVADCVGRDVTDFIARTYPDVIVIAFETRKSVPELRAAGILRARGDIVAMTEDHCLATPDWFASMVQAHEKHPYYAIGGSVDNAATERVIDWAVYLCEYSAFTSPIPEGVSHDLPGPNVSYKRAAVEAMRDMLQDGGYWETFLHQRLESMGQALYADPHIRILHRKYFTLSDFLSERFHYGRWYAGTRIQFVTPAKRLFYLVFSPLLPPLLIKRLYDRVKHRGRHADEFRRCLPLIVLFTLAWAAGEFIGYATGAGRSVMKLS